MEKDDAWLQSINWIPACIECQRETNGTCSRASCAKMHYDEDGNHIHPSTIKYDGDCQLVDCDGNEV